MSLRERIMGDLNDATKAGDRLRLGVIRLLRSEILSREVDLRPERGRDYRLSDDEVLAVLTRAAKRCNESIEGFRQGGRDDLVAKEEAELAVIEGYLPTQLSEDDLRALVREAIAEVGAASPSDLGAVMKVLMPKVKGRADGKRVNRMVREALERPA